MWNSWKSACAGDWEGGDAPRLQVRLPLVQAVAGNAEFSGNLRRGPAATLQQLHRFAFELGAKPFPLAHTTPPWDMLSPFQGVCQTRATSDFEVLTVLERGGARTVAWLRIHEFYWGLLEGVR